MKIVITGASGFIGSYLTTYFLKKNFKVFSLYRNKKPNLINKNYIKIDKFYSNHKNLPKQCDVIIHCSTFFSLRSKNKDKDKHQESITVTDNIIKYAIKSKVKYFFFMSSVNVCGRRNQKEITERTKIINPSNYGKSKKECEERLDDFSKRYNIPCITFRLPGVLGSGSKNNYISDTNNLIKKNKRIFAHSRNLYFNNVVHVSNLANNIFYALKKMKKDHKIFVLASKSPLQFYKILSLLYKAAKKKENISWSNVDRINFLIDTKKSETYGFKLISTQETINLYVKS